MKNKLIDRLRLIEDYEKYKDKVILSDKKGEMTYAAFIWQSMRYGMQLMEEGHIGQPLLMRAEHDSTTLVWFVAALLSGNYYVPISPDTPSERMTAIMELLKRERLNPYFVGGKYMSVESRPADVDFDAASWDMLKDWRSRSSCDLLSIMFTSGSTGEPKGIYKTQSGMWDFLAAYIEEFGLLCEDIIGNQSPFCFDASAKDIFTMLYLKCKMVILDKDEFFPPVKLAEKMNRERISVIQWVPSALTMLSAVNVFKTVRLEYLKKVLFVGEVFPVKQLKRWVDSLPDTEFINIYGSSEMSGVCAFCKVTPEMLDGGGSVPIGSVMSNCRLVLVENGHISKKGEIFVQSATISPGYVGDSAKSKAMHVDGRTFGEEGEFYATGDLAYYNEDGLLVFTSRSDYQIKHMGHRIELGDIEGAAGSCEDVTECCCIYKNNRLILVFSGTGEREELASYMEKRLPVYMLPNRYVKMDMLTHNTNGKIDRKKLEELV